MGEYLKPLASIDAVGQFLDRRQVERHCLEGGTRRFLSVQPSRSHRFLVLTTFVLCSCRHISLCLKLLAERRESLIEYVLQVLRSELILRNMLIQCAIFLQVYDNTSLHCGVVRRLLGCLLPYETDWLARWECFPFYMAIG